MTEDFLPYGKHSIDQADIDAVVDVLTNGPLTCGPKITEFETAFAAYIGAREAVVCSNGTAALHLAAIEAGLKEGDVAIVPSITFLATANAVRMTGAEVCFADVDSESGLMSSDDFKHAVAKSPRKPTAVLPVHMNGQSGEMAEIAAFARANDISIITDCCHALGADYVAGGKPGDGQFEDFGTFSLHPVKSIAMGEGGVITTSDPGAAQRLRMLRGHAMEKTPDEWQNPDEGHADDGNANPWYYEMQMLAYNYRATDIQCALGLSQLKKLPTFIAKRRQVADWYDKHLCGFSNHLKPINRSTDSLSAWHLYAVQIDFDAVGKDRAAVMMQLAASNVGTQVHYVPVSSQPYYTARYGQQNLPGADAYYRQILSLPIFPAMEEADVKQVADALRRVLHS